jgi:hypothetical protein
VLLMIGAPLLPGSLWGLLGVVLLLPLLAARALGEEVMLLDGCPVIANTPQKCASAHARCMVTSRACDDAARKEEPKR